MSGAAHPVGARVRVHAHGTTWNGDDVHDRTGTVVYVAESQRWRDVDLDGGPPGDVVPVHVDDLTAEGTR